MNTSEENTKCKGQILYEEAKKIIPGGTQLLSKKPEIFLPEGWPSYYSKAKGCYVWNLEGERFVDMTTNGIGACLLGFADDDINNAVKTSIDNGSMSTLNPPDEVALAKKLCEIHPWAEMARFARTGGESMSIAVRIARACKRKDKVAICGYHGWSDWYLAANLSTDKALDGLLMPGLTPNGVPRGLAGTVLPFHYNKIEELENIATDEGENIAAIVMEPLRDNMPENGFLTKVRKIADQLDAVLIFDEITSGWRFNHGGIHLELGVNPDIAVFAKSISNGFPMAAIIGREEVMNAAQSTFISSTYWTEAIGPAAALATLNKMESSKVSSHVKKIGALVQEGWKKLAKKYKLNINITGLPALSHFLFTSDRGVELKTLMTQEMLKKGFLASTSFYPTLAHTEDIVYQYLVALDEVFAMLAESSDNKHLDIPAAQSGFARLT